MNRTRYCQQSYEAKRQEVVDATVVEFERLTKLCYCYYVIY